MCEDPASRHPLWDQKYSSWQWMLLHLHVMSLSLSGTGHNSATVHPDTESLALRSRQGLKCAIPSPCRLYITSPSILFSSSQLVFVVQNSPAECKTGLPGLPGEDTTSPPHEQVSVRPPQGGAISVPHNLEGCCLFAAARKKNPPAATGVDTKRCDALAGLFTHLFFISEFFRNVCRCKA